MIRYFHGHRQAVDLLVYEVGTGTGPGPTSGRRSALTDLHLLRKAYDESPDTVRFNLFARSTVTELRERGGSTVRSDVQDLARKLDIAS